ncbi:HNH endonuclease [Rhodococcus jostii]|uniref:HNH endonuclease n=1 Tax=Rhodococcus jostii TaxID=132919 RepID=UPI003645ECF6
MRIRSIKPEFYALSERLSQRERPDPLPDAVDANSLLEALVLAADPQGRFYADPVLLRAHFLIETDQLSIFRWREELLLRGDIVVAPIAENCYGGTHLILTIQGKFRFQRWRNRAPIPKQVRGEVYARDGHMCVACGSTDDLSLDHIIPWSHGGPDSVDNFQTLCRPCNSKKGARGHEWTHPNNQA